MTMEEFRSLLDAWGADAARWPGDRRAGAEALLARSAEARDLLAREAAFDALLAGAPAAAPGDALMNSILAIPATARQEKRGRRGFAFGSLFPFTPAFPRFAGLAAAAMLGFYIGTTSLFQPAQSLAADSETVNITDYVFGDAADGEMAP
jgi:hypothetical protein